MRPSTTGAATSVRFPPDEERPARPVRPGSNEVDYPVLYDEPHPAVLGALRTAPDRPHLWTMLPGEL
ncbi:hypothetical protein GCM10017752_61660 [Streptomyces roseoviridis]